MQLWEIEHIPVGTQLPSESDVEEYNCKVAMLMVKHATNELVLHTGKDDGKRSPLTDTANATTQRCIAVSPMQVWIQMRRHR